MRKFLLLIVLMACCSMVLAVPAFPGLVTKVQADGSRIDCYIHGDEHFSYLTSEDDYLLAYNEQGLLEYAELVNGVAVVPNGMRAHNAVQRSVAEQFAVGRMKKAKEQEPQLRDMQQKFKAMAREGKQNFPLYGSPKGLILLASFQDVRFSTSAQVFRDKANERGYSQQGATGSIKDYFMEASFGQFSPQFDVYGPYVLPHDMEYYGERTAGSNDVNPYQMVIDVCNAADDDVDFAEYDNDHDGKVDNIFVYYAGHNEAEGGPSSSVWPHRSSISYYQIKLDGVSLVDYACTSEYRGSSGNSICGIGTFCHEFSHVLGLPDFYDTDYLNGASPMGSWDIMTNGNYNNGGNTPPTYTAYERFYLGWLTPTPLTNIDTVDCEGSYRLKSLISSNTAYLISKTPHNLVGSGPSPNEFFMLEYRKREGMDTYTYIGEGMLITHIVYSGGSWASNKPNNDRTNLGYEIILPNTASGTYGSDHDVFPGELGVSNCRLTLRRDAEPMSREIRNIVDLDSCVEFDYITRVENLTINVCDIDAYYDQEYAYGEFLLLGRAIGEAISLSFGDNHLGELAMRVKTEGDTESFASQIQVLPEADSTISATIEVRYKPRSITYDEYRQNKIVAKGTRTSTLTCSETFRYRNRRPIYITAPEAYKPEMMSSTTAKLLWSPVLDTVPEVGDYQRFGAKYYVDLYNVKEEASYEKEDFENFPESMGEGWEANFKNFSNIYKQGAVSAVFSSNTDVLITPEYCTDVTEISFWIRSMTSEGTLSLWAQNYESGEWRKLTDLPINISTSGTESFNVPLGYRRFKINYQPKSGQLAFDDFTAKLDKKFTYILKDKYTGNRDTTLTVSGLTAGETYHFVVRASDKDENGADGKPRYENISVNSNEIIFVAEGGQSDDEIEIQVVKEGDRYVAYLSELKEREGEPYTLFIYSMMDGKLVAQVDAAETRVELPMLAEGAFYVVRYTAASAPSRKDPFVKIICNSK